MFFPWCSCHWGSLVVTCSDSRGTASLRRPHGDVSYYGIPIFHYRISTCGHVKQGLSCVALTRVMRRIQTSEKTFPCARSLCTRWSRNDYLDFSCCHMGTQTGSLGPGWIFEMEMEGMEAKWKTYRGSLQGEKTVMNDEGEDVAWNGEFRSFNYSRRCRF